MRYAYIAGKGHKYRLWVNPTMQGLRAPPESSPVRAFDSRKAIAERCKEVLQRTERGCPPAQDDYDDVFIEAVASLHPTIALKLAGMRGPLDGVRKYRLHTEDCFFLHDSEIKSTNPAHDAQLFALKLSRVKMFNIPQHEFSQYAIKTGTDLLDMQAKGLMAENDTMDRIAVLSNQAVREALAWKESHTQWKLMSALRSAVVPQIRAFRDSAPRPLVSAVSGQTIASTDDVQVDHAPPLTFARLASDWIAAQEPGAKKTTASAMVGPEGFPVFALFYEESARSWREYHAQNACLRIVTKRENAEIERSHSLTLSRRDMKGGTPQRRAKRPRATAPDEPAKRPCADEQPGAGTPETECDASVSTAQE